MAPILVSSAKVRNLEADPKGKMGSFGGSPTKKRSARYKCGQTTHDWADSATVHGVSYVFDRGQPCFPRFLWLLVVLFFAGLAASWSVTAYLAWQDNPVITSIETTGYSIAKLHYPAITICSQGVISQVTESILRYQVEREAKKEGVDISKMTPEELMTFEDKAYKKLYPGSDGQDPTFISATLTNSNPEAQIESAILNDAGFDPCSTFSNNENSTAQASAPNETICMEGWFNVDATVSKLTLTCHKNMGTGQGGQDPCFDEGGFSTRFGNQEQLNDFVSYISPQESSGSGSGAGSGSGSGESEPITGKLNDFDNPSKA